MSISQALAKNASLQLIGKAVSTGLGMVAVAVMTRSLGVEQFGWYVTAFGFLQFVGLISDFGFTVTTSNLLAEPAFDRRTVLNVAFTWRFITALVFQLLAPIVFLFFPYRSEIKLAVGLCTISFFALAISQVFLGYFREGLKIRVPVMAEIIGRIILVAGVAATAFLNAPFLVVMGVITLASVISAIYLWLRVGPITFSLNKPVSLALWHKLAPTALTVMLNAIYLQGDRVLLPLFVNQTDVAFYGASYRVLDIIIQMASLIMGLVMPLITYAWSRQLLVEFKQRLDLGFTLLTLTILPMAIGVIMLAKPIIVFIAGPNFAPAGAILAWLTISMFGVVFGMAFGHVMLAINRQKEAVYIYGSCALLSLAGYLLFIPKFGVWGAIGVTIFSEWYTGLGLLLLTRRYARTLPALKPVIYITLSGAVMALALLPVINRSLAITVPFGVIVYGVALVVSGVIKPSQIKIFFSR